MNATSIDFEDLPQLDPQRVAELRGLRNGGLFAALSVGFREQGQREISELRQAIAAGDLDRGIMVAHSLKSSSVNIGAQTVGAIARRIEGDLYAGTTDSLEALFHELEENFRKALEELTALG